MLTKLARRQTLLRLAEREALLYPYYCQPTRRAILTAFLVIAVPQAGIAQVDSVRPVRVVDLRQIVHHDLSLPNVVLREITQANGMWAALMRSPGREGSVIVAGPPNSEHAMITAARFDKIAIDSQGRMFLRKVTLGKEGSEVSALDQTGSEMNSLPMPYLATPILSQGAVHWRPQKHADFERGIVLGLPARRYLELGSRTEMIVLHDFEGKVLSSAAADLDAAYASIGRSFPKQDIESSTVSRIMWAATSPDGRLYVCLSGTSAAGPAYLAVLDPGDGHLLRLLSAELPTSPNRVAASNPKGVIWPVLGAIGDQLIIADRAADVLAIYELN